MPAYKQNNGTWICKYAYKDGSGKFRHICKRGFATKKEALEWEMTSKTKIKGTCDLKIKEFVDLYFEYIKPRNKFSTYNNKTIVINNFIVKYLGDIKVNELTVLDVVRWQTRLMEYKDPVSKKPFSKAYLRLINTYLKAILNYAVKFHNLPKNVAQIAGGIGSYTDKEMKFWTRDQYLKFAEVMMDKPIYYYAFEILYYTGIREGELLALQIDDIDFDKKEMSINKTYAKYHGEDMVTSPKTKKSNRKVAIPDFLCEEIKDYIKTVYTTSGSKTRLFTINKSTLTKEIQKGADDADLPRIRVHDLRHSHVSLLIELGYSAVAIAERMGHESINVTLRYAHLFPNTQQKMANDLNRIYEEEQQ